MKNGHLTKFGHIKKGLIATGDSFISDESLIKSLKEELPNSEALRWRVEHLLKSLNKKGFHGCIESNFR